MKCNKAPHANPCQKLPPGADIVEDSAMPRLNVITFALLCAAPLRAAAPDPQALADRIDRHLDAAIKKAKAIAAPTADDAEFLRRAYLDLTGRIPSPHDVHEFLGDKDADKRRKLIDDLLETPRHAAHYARLWRALLLPEADADAPARIFQPGFEAWLRQRFRSNTAYDRLVRDLLTTPISADPKSPQAVLPRPSDPNPLAFFAAKEGRPENLAAATSRLFLGVQLECAQCHDHPFARWSRDQFWQQAAFFAGLNRHGDGAFAPLSEDVSRHKLSLPGNSRVVTAVFLDGKKPTWDEDSKPRTVLAEWVTSPDNRYFARTAVNRVWGLLTGRGLVEPVDDFHDENPPSHPELLDELARSFVEAKYDLRFLIRGICRSKAYQRTSARTHASQDDPRLFARMTVKGLTADQLFDSLALATGYRDRDGRGSTRSLFLARFTGQGKAETSIPQALTLMNGRFVEDATGLEKGETLAAVVGTPGMDTAQRIEALYMATLSRKPTQAERDRANRHIAKGGKGREAERLADVLWMLLNSVEFRVNH
jgi:hypothetical protein